MHQPRGICFNRRITNALKGTGSSSCFITRRSTHRRTGVRAIHPPHHLNHLPPRGNHPIILRTISDFPRENEFIEDAILFHHPQPSLRRNLPLMLSPAFLPRTRKSIPPLTLSEPQGAILRMKVSLSPCRVASGPS